MQKIHIPQGYGSHGCNHFTMPNGGHWRKNRGHFSSKVTRQDRCKFLGNSLDKLIQCLCLQMGADSSAATQAMILSTCRLNPSSGMRMRIRGLMDLQSNKKPPVVRLQLLPCSPLAGSAATQNSNTQNAVAILQLSYWACHQKILKSQIAVATLQASCWVYPTWEGVGSLSAWDSLILTWTRDWVGQLRWAANLLTFTKWSCLVCILGQSVRSPLAQAFGSSLGSSLGSSRRIGSSWCWARTHTFAGEAVSCFCVFLE